MSVIASIQHRLLATRTVQLGTELARRPAIQGEQVDHLALVTRLRLDVVQRTHPVLLWIRPLPGQVLASPRGERVDRLVPPLVQDTSGARPVQHDASFVWIPS